LLYLIYLIRNINKSINLKNNIEKNAYLNSANINIDKDNKKNLLQRNKTEIEFQSLLTEKSGLNFLTTVQINFNQYS